MKALATVVALLAAFTSAADDFDAFFREFKEKRDGIEALSASFVQNIFLPEEVLTTEGTLRYAKQRRLLFSTREPERATLVDGRRGYEYDAEIKQLQVFDIEDHPRADIFFLGFDDDTESLRAAYDVSLLILDDARGRHGIKIKPKPGSEAEDYFLEVNLYLRDADFLPYRIHIRNDEESQLFIDINDIQILSLAEAGDIRIELPEGTTIVENDRVVATIGPEGGHVPRDAQKPVISERELAPLQPLDPPPDTEPGEPVLTPSS